MKRKKREKRRKYKSRLVEEKRRRNSIKEENVCNLTLQSGLAHPTTGSNRVCSIVAVPHSWSKPDAF